MIKILILFQLFCILIFSKTSGHMDTDAIEVKVQILWRHLPQMKNLAKLSLSEWKENERFKLRLLRVESGMVILPPIASGKTGHYDFASLKIEPQIQIGTQNVMGRGKELAESSRNIKGKGIVQQFELQIKMISPENFSIQQQPVIKRFNEMPNPNEILICVCDPRIEFECFNSKNDYKYMQMPRPERKIFFEFENKNFDASQIYGIECIKIEGTFLLPEIMNCLTNFVEYTGPVCPSDEYTFHFDFLENGKNKSLSFKCDEAIYVNPKINTYHLSLDGKCKLKLIEENIEEDLQIPSNTSKRNMSSSHLIAFDPQQQRKKLKGKSESTFNNPSMPPKPFNILNLPHLSNLPMANEQNIIHRFEDHHGHQPHQPISSDFLRDARYGANEAQYLQQQQSPTNLLNFQAGSTPSRVLEKSATMPRDHSDLRNTKQNLQGQSSNPMQGSSVAASEIGQIVLPTNPQPSQIASNLQQFRRQYLRQHSDLGHSSSQIHGIGQQIQPSGMLHSQKPLQIENPSQQPESPSMQGHRSTGGGARFRWRPSGSANLPTKVKHTKQLLGTMEQQPIPPNLQMNIEEEKSDDEQTMLGLGLMRGQKRVPNDEKDGEDKDEEGPSAGQKSAKMAKKH